jgi:site-specific recombinase XerD
LARISEAAGFPWLVHPHQLLHAIGYKLANSDTDTRTLQHYLGHRSIEHTVPYSELAADRFARAVARLKTNGRRPISRGALSSRFIQRSRKSDPR